MTAQTIESTLTAESLTVQLTVDLEEFNRQFEQLPAAARRSIKGKFRGDLLRALHQVNCSISKIL